MKTYKIISFLFIFLLTSCNFQQGKIVVTNSGKSVITNLNISDNTLTLTGVDLHVFSSVKIQSSTSTTTLYIDSKETDKLVVSSSGNLSIGADDVMRIILTNGFGSVTYEFQYSMCESTFDGASFNCNLTPANHDILSFSSSLNKWLPRSPFWKRIRNISANYTLVENDSVVDANTTSASLTITLPTATTSKGHLYTLKKSDTSLNTVTIATTGAEIIEGASTLILSMPNQVVTIVSDGVKWSVVSSSGRVISCPTTMIQFGSGRNIHCIEKTYRAAANYRVASNTCLAAGYKLCSYQEWVVACFNGAPFSAHGTAYEWVNDALPNASAGRAVIVSTALPCGVNSQNTLGHVDNPYYFRCCLK